MQRLALIRTDRLGETLLTLPVLDALRAARPDVELTFVVSPSTAPLFEALPGARVVAFPHRLDGPAIPQAVALAARLRPFRFHAALISNPSKALHLGAWLAGIPRRIGYARKWGGCLTDRLPDERAHGNVHEVRSNVQLLAPLGVPVPEHPELRLPVSREADAAVGRLLDQARLARSGALIVIHPWSSNPLKRWPARRFAELIARVSSERDAGIVLIGGPDEAARAEDVVPGQAANVLNLVGELSLPELAALLARARVLVTNDSGPMHVAASVGTPVVALFGVRDPGSHPRRWGPWGTGHTVLHQDLDALAVEPVLHAVSTYLR